MGLSETLLPEFDHEMATTRKVLERVPENKLAWTPHEKSWSMGHLATQLANLPTWAVHTIDEESFDVAPSWESEATIPPVVSVQELLDLFDTNVAAARLALVEVAPSTA